MPCLVLCVGGKGLWSEAEQLVKALVVQRLVEIPSQHTQEIFHFFGDQGLAHEFVIKGQLLEPFWQHQLINWIGHAGDVTRIHALFSIQIPILKLPDSHCRLNVDISA